MENLAPRGQGARGRIRNPIVLAGIAVAAIAGAVVSVAALGGLASGGPVAAATASPSAAPVPTDVQPTPTAAPPTPEPTAAPTPEPTPVLVAAPLTGLDVPPEAALRHPIAVMVDDAPAARPQAGLNAASIVWQAPAEGGVPRYMLVFQETVPASVGPIRSARQYYIEWAAEYSALYVHHGGSPQALETLARRGSGQWVWNADGFRWEGRYVFRVDDRFAPHNVMTDGEHLRALAARVGAEDGAIGRPWSFTADRRAEMRPRDGTIIIRYPYETVSYGYDPATNTYRRSVGLPGEKVRPQVDLGDGQRVAPKNVVILRMAFGPLDDGHPDKHRLEAHNIGKGEAWIATNGRTIKGQWRKASATAPTLLFDTKGNPITLTAGQTFVQVIALEYDFQIRDGRQPVYIEPRLRRAEF